MLKNLLLILVLLPVLCFSQYEWTDKGDYKVLEYPDEIKQAGFSNSGDSLLIRAKHKVSIFDSEGMFLDSLSNYHKKFDNTIFFSSDMKSYIICDIVDNYYYADVISSVYSFKNNDLIAKDTININVSNPPFYTGDNIQSIEYSSIYNKFYYYGSELSNPNGSNSSSYGSGGIRFSNSMKYYFSQSSSNSTEGDNSSYHISTQMNEKYIYDNENNDSLYYYFNKNFTDYYGNSVISSGSETIGEYINNVAFSKDEEYAILSNKNTFYQYTLNPFNKVKGFSIDFIPSYYEFSNDNRLVFLSNGKYIFMLDLETEQLSRLIKIDELERDFMIASHPTDLGKLAIISIKNIFLCDIDFSAKPVADFVRSYYSYQITDSVQLFNMSLGQNLEYEWDFGDGYISHEENPKHLYANTGKYAIKLKVSNENGSDDTIKVDYLNIVEKQLFADFDIDYDESKFPIICYIKDKSVGENYKRKWILNNNTIIYDLDSTSFVINSPGKCTIELNISKGNFVDIKHDTVVIEANYTKIDNLVNERIINTNNKLETYNILEYDDNYYFNFVYDSVDIGYVSEIYKMDKDYNYNKQMRFEGFSYPPYEPTIYQDKLVFKYDSSLKMNDLSYLGTDFDGNILFNYSQMFGKNSSLKYPEYKINTTRLKVFNDSLYVLGTYGYGFKTDNRGDKYESAKSYLYKINSSQYNAVQIDSLTYKRNYDTDFFIDKNLRIFSYLNFYDIMHNYHYFNHCIINNNDGFIISTTGRSKNFPRINDNYFNENYMFSNFKDKMIFINLTNGSTLFEYKLPGNSSAHKIIQKGDSLYIAGSYEYEPAFYIYNLKSNELDSVVLESRIGEFTDLRFNEKGNLVLFGKLNYIIDDNIYIAEYDFDLTNNGGGTIEPKDSTELDVFHNLIIYPNPVTEDLLIQFESESAQDVVLKIYNIDGTFIQEVVSDVTEGDNQIHVKLKNIAKGVYIVNVKTDKGIFSRKFVKE